ncbi:hypothetical protein ETB97_006266 [Aspergillus alliaceus]|uniref:Uncharacterized protein n=1 Tax=Petromyces alliaceus TaxID=209559 RepID=A0A5N7C9S7_PETAA|nr:uncharacterized protein BDW43DRAFT_308005 [Aspergillus alliaceus]KAB8236992.1 hypothetical protein BDW43DRAFT_308005 [Aspergillus alliaceus]KAE8390890.1 hypothetical protein BDV23DRAFT_183012 [Aspergillus alliaceus]KAF5857087.1 hypothetical protein ETB97_006266 [Aspergillus burnettii]
MSSLFEIPRGRYLEIPGSTTYASNSRSKFMHDLESTPSSPPEKALPVSLAHYDNSFILPPAIHFDSIHKSTRETPSGHSSRSSPWKSPSLSANTYEWGSNKDLDKDALSSLQEYCSSFDQVRLLKRGLQRLV